MFLERHPSLDKCSLLSPLDGLDYLFSPRSCKTPDISHADPGYVAEQLTYWDAVSAISSFLLIFDVSFFGMPGYWIFPGVYSGHFYFRSCLNVSSLISAKVVSGLGEIKSLIHRRMFIL